jgi:DNA-directed RNA polymerase specialized sigma24 family protein
VSACTLSVVTPIADLLREIRDEPELTEPDPARQAAEARLAEADLVERVLFEIKLGSKYEGPAHRQLFEDLWIYAWPVIKAFLRTNRMNQLVRRYLQHGYGYVSISPEDMVVLHQSEAERDALALDVIAIAVESFRKRAIVRRQWSPTGGASLRTWFIGTCAINFPRAYERWSRDRADRVTRVAKRHELDLDAVGTEFQRRASDPSVIVTSRSDLQALIDRAQPTTKLILGLLMEGHTQAEIAAELGLTVRAVEGRIYRFRARIRGYRYVKVSHERTARLRADRSPR